METVQCKYASDCSNQGICVSGSCECYRLYQGKHCEISWASKYEHWKVVFDFYVYFVIVLQSIVVIVAIIDLYRNFNRATKRSSEGKTSILHTVVTQVLIGLSSAGIIRILYYSIDPHRSRKIFDPVLESILFWAPVLIWIDMGFLVILYWVELQRASQIQEIKSSVSKLRAPLIAVAVGTAIVMIPIGVWNAFGDEIARLLMAFFIMFLLLMMVGSTLFYGTKLLSMIRRLYHITRNEAYRTFLQKVTMVLWAMSGFLGSIIITLIVFAFYGQTAWGWLCIMIIESVEEFGVCATMLLLCHKRIPSTESEKPINTPLLAKRSAE